MLHRKTIIVYSAAALQGFAFTLVPSLATQFGGAPFNINAQAFGELFIPLTLGAIIAAMVTPRLARAYGMVRILRLGVVANILGLLALVASAFVPHQAAFPLLLADTTALGLGFGFNFTAVNELASLLGANPTRSVTIANVLTGLGTATTPLFIGTLASRGIWPAWPTVLIVAFSGILIVSFGWRVAANPEAVGPSQPISRTLIFFGLAALLYAFCEGIFSSWATTYVHVDRRFSLVTAEVALSGFWFALTATRLVAAFTTRTLTPRIAIIVFPIAIGIALLLLPVWTSAPLLILGFILAGVGCSIVFPYTMSLALAAMPAQKNRVAGVLVAALMTGEGLGTFAIGVLRSANAASLAHIYSWSACAAFALSIVAVLASKASPVSAVKSRK
ncbi:MAG: MFS transporter [Vulcanimicrobiaceae bacterium]